MNATQTNLDSGLSPLIECPCGDRITKTFPSTSEILATGKCAAVIDSEQACTAAVASLVTVSGTATVNNASEASGCLMVPTGTAGVYSAVFNAAAKSAASCDASAAVDKLKFTWTGPFNRSMISCAESGCMPSDPKVGT